MVGVKELPFADEVPWDASQSTPLDTTAERKQKAPVAGEMGGRRRGASTSWTSIESFLQARPPVRKVTPSSKHDDQYQASHLAALIVCGAKRSLRAGATSTHRRQIVPALLQRVLDQEEVRFIAWPGNPPRVNGAVRTTRAKKTFIRPMSGAVPLGPGSLRTEPVAGAIVTMVPPRPCRDTPPLERQGRAVRARADVMDSIVNQLLRGRPR